MHFTVITPTYNRRQFLPEAVASVRATITAPLDIQFEHLILENASTDDTAAWLRTAAPAKLRALLHLLARDYFPLLLLLAVSWLLVARLGAEPGRSRFWAVQAGYVAVVLALGVGLKLPPRVALPLLDLWLLSNLAFLLSGPQLLGAKGRVLLLGALAVAVGPYCYKTLHRRTVLRAERHQNQATRAAYAAAVPPGALLVTDGVLPATYKAASPFRNPDAHPARVLLLAGWTTADPSQPAWRQQLTGTRAYAETMRRLLARGPAVRWLLTPTGAAVLKQQLRQLPPSATVQLQPEPPTPAGAEVPRFYRGGLETP